MKASLLAILLISLAPSILAAAGGWRFVHGANDLGEVTVATNLSDATATVKPGDFLPGNGYFAAATGAIKITLTGPNIPGSFETIFVPPTGYSTLVAAGPAPTLKTFTDPIATAQKIIGGSQDSAIRLINGVNSSVSLKYNGTGFSDFIVASTDGFLDASDYQMISSADPEGIFFVVDENNNVLAEVSATLDVAAVYTAFFSMSNDSNVATLKLKLSEDQPTLTVSYVRAVHAVPDLKAEVDVDVLYTVTSNATVAANISYFTVSDFVDTMPGNNEVLLRPHGGNESSIPFAFENFANYTILVFGFANSTEIQVISDVLTTTNTSALVRFINVIPGTPVTTGSVRIPYHLGLLMLMTTHRSRTRPTPPRLCRATPPHRPRTPLPTSRLPAPRP